MSQFLATLYIASSRWRFSSSWKTCKKIGALSQLLSNLLRFDLLPFYSGGIFSSRLPVVAICSCGFSHQTRFESVNLTLGIHWQQIPGRSPLAFKRRISLFCRKTVTKCNKKNLWRTTRYVRRLAGYPYNVISKAYVLSSHQWHTQNTYEYIQLR